MHVVDLDWAGGDNGFVEREVVAARPTPLFWFFDQSLPNRVHVHIVQAFSEFLAVANKTIPELALPSRTAGLIGTVDLK